MRYILFLILACGCSNLSDEDKSRMIEANSILALFEQDYKSYATVGRVQSKPIRYNFTDLSSMGKNIAGVCYISGDFRYIQYDREHWDELSYLEKVNLVYHEQGHCQLDREHKCSTDNDIYSLMYPYIFHKEYLEIFLDEMKMELLSITNQRINDCPQDLNGSIDEEVTSSYQHFVFVRM